MKKITAKAYHRLRGETVAVKVKAYTYDDVFCFHRDARRPRYWRLTHISSGMCDGNFYKTREKALLKYCETEWHEKCVKAAEKITLDISEYPVKEINEKGEIVDALN